MKPTPPRFLSLLQGSLSEVVGLQRLKRTRFLLVNKSLLALPYTHAQRFQTAQVLFKQLVVPKKPGCFVAPPSLPKPKKEVLLKRIPAPLCATKTTTTSSLAAVQLWQEVMLHFSVSSSSCSAAASASSIVLLVLLPSQNQAERPRTSLMPMTTTT